MKKIKTSALLFVLIIAMSGLANAAAKQIIVLSVETDPGQIRVNYLLWITTASPIPVPGAVSQWKGASVPENAAIAAGTTIEIQRTLAAPQGTSKAAIQTQLQNIWTQTQNAATAQPSGCFFDGTVWSC